MLESAEPVQQVGGELLRVFNAICGETMHAGKNKTLPVGEGSKFKKIRVSVHQFVTDRIRFFQ
jgi:hypothetical protein